MAVYPPLYPNCIDDNAVNNKAMPPIKGMNSLNSTVHIYINGRGIILSQNKRSHPSVNIVRQTHTKHIHIHKNKLSASK